MVLGKTDGMSGEDRYVLCASWPNAPSGNPAGTVNNVLIFNNRLI